MRYFIPQSLHKLPEILNENGYEFYSKAMHIVKFYWFIDKLVMPSIHNKDYKQGKYVRLQSVILKKLMGDDYYKSIINLLELFGIIDIEPEAIPRLQSYGYRLTERYMDETPYWVDIEDTSTFAKRAIRFNNDKLNHYVNNKVYNSILCNLRDIAFNYNLLKDYIEKFIKEINLNYYFSLISNHMWCVFLNNNKIEIVNTLNRVKKGLNINYYFSLYNSHMWCVFSKPKKIDYKSLKFDTNRKVDNTRLPILNKFNSEIMAISSILLFNTDSFNKNLGIHFTICKQGRVHNNITNLSRNLRKCLMMDGSIELTNNDFKSCQPLLLALLTRERLGERYKDSKSANKFMAICINADIYIYLMKKINYKGTRDDFKKVFYSNILFGKVFDNDLTRIFKKEFPDVYKIIVEVKKKSYKDLAIKLQMMESNLMYGGIIPALLDKNKSLNFLTIHDSILCRKEDSKLVTDTMEAVIKRKYGVSVRVGVDKYNHDEEQLPNMDEVEIMQEIIEEAQSEELKNEYKQMRHAIKLDRERKMITSKKREQDRIEVVAFNSIFGDMMEMDDDY